VTKEPWDENGSIIRARSKSLNPACSSPTKDFSAVVKIFYAPPKIMFPGNRRKIGAQIDETHENKVYSSTVHAFFLPSGIYRAVGRLYGVETIVIS
jgi:hypothetical protein